MTQLINTELKTNGRWTKEEHEKFLLGLQLFGKDWKKIQDFIQTRNGAQIRSHAQKFFLRLKKQLPNQKITNQQLKQNDCQNSLVNQSSHDSAQNDYSYFVGKIVKISSQKEEFDFWDSLIDQKDADELDHQTGITKRKNSFVAWDDDNEQISSNKPSKKTKTS